MDFSALVAELRNIANKYHGRDTDANVSTAMYCEMFRKILQKANMGTTSYGDQIVILWMTLSQLRNTAEALSACSARDSLYQHIFLLCAKTVLNIKWQQLEDEDLKSKQNLRATVEATHSQLQLAGFDRFGLLLPLMDDPWTDPILSQIMAGEDTESDEAKEYINKEDCLILKLRVEMLIQESCEEFALNLCECCLEHEKFKDDLELTQKQLFLLFKLNNTDRLQEVCEKIPCHTGIKIILKMEQKESNQAICVRLIQTFLVQDWVNPERNCCTNELLKLWIRHQYLTDKNKEKFLESVWAIAKLSSNTSQICVLVTGLQKECGFSLLQLYTDLLVFAINFDKGQCEQEMLKGHMEGVKKHQLAISNTCKKLAELYEVVNPKIARVGILTAFALNATGQSLLAVKKTFCDSLNEGRKHGPGLCPADCISPECRRKKFMGGKTDRKSKEELYNDSVNPATLHEVERLLNMLRPYYLNPELSWQKLQSVCYKFLAEKGLSGHDKQKDQTVIMEGLVNSEITDSVKSSDHSKSIVTKSPVTDQTKATSVKPCKIQSPETASHSAATVSQSILGPSATSHKKKASTTSSNPQIFNSYQNMYISSLSSPVASKLSQSVVNQRQSASSSNFHQQQRTASQQSVAELLAQTARPSATLKSSKLPSSPLSADLAHLEQQIKISTLLAETAAQKSAKSSAKSNKRSGQASGSKTAVSKINDSNIQKQQLNTPVSSAPSIFNLISLEDIKKQLRDAQIAATNKIVKIPVTMQSGFIVQQPQQVVTYRPPNPTSVKSQPRQRRPRILSNTSRFSNQQQLIHTDLNLIQKQGSAINKAMQVSQSVSKTIQNSHTASKVMQINQSATTVIPSQNLLNQPLTTVQPNQNLLNQSPVQTSLNLLHTVTNPSIQAGVINQGLTILQAKSLNNAVGATLSSIKAVSQGQAVNQSNQSATTVGQSIQLTTTDPTVDSSSAFYIGNILQTPIQIKSMQNTKTALGADVLNLVPQSISDTNKLSGLSKASTPVFNIAPSATPSDKLSNIKPPSVTISMNNGTANWSNVKPPSSSLNVTYSNPLKTINAVGSLPISFSTTSFPPYQRQVSASIANIARNPVSSGSKIIPANVSTVKTSADGTETLPSDVVNLLVQENPKQDNNSNKNVKLQLAVKAPERRPSADELKSIVDWLQTGTEDAVNKPAVTMTSSLVNKATVGKSTVKSGFENVKTNLVLTPPQTTLTVQNLSSLQFIESTAANKLEIGNTQITTVHCNTQGSKQVILSTKSQNQLATNFLGTAVNTGKQSVCGRSEDNTTSDQSITSKSVSVTMTTLSNTSTVSSSISSNSTSTKNLASAVLFPFTTLSSETPSNITFVDSSKLKPEHIKHLLYLGQIKSGALNVQPKTMVGSEKQHWPEIGTVMSNAKQFVREMYARKAASTTVLQPETTSSSSTSSSNIQGPSSNIQGPSSNIQGPSSNIQGPSSNIQELSRDIPGMLNNQELSSSVQGPSNTIQGISSNIQGTSSNIQGTISASTEFVESSNSLATSDQTTSESSSSQLENKQVILESSSGLVSEGKRIVEGQNDNTDNTTSREILTKVVENELKQIIIQADISESSKTAEQKLGETSTDVYMNRLTTSTDLDITEPENCREDDNSMNKGLQKPVSEEKVVTVTNNVEEKCSLEDISVGDKVTSNQLIVLRKEVVEEIVDIETTHDSDISQRDLILSDNEGNSVEKTTKNNDDKDGQHVADVNKTVGVSETNLSEKVQNVPNLTKSGLCSVDSNSEGKSEDISSSVSDKLYPTDTDNVDSLQCLICKKIFKSVENLKDHVRDVCKPTLTSESQFYSCIYYCSNCSYRSESKAYMALHIKDCENTVYTEHNIKLPNIYKRFCCRMCGQICLTKENVLEHISSDCKHRKGTGETRIDESATKLSSNSENIGSESKQTDSEGISEVISEPRTVNDDNTSVHTEEDENITVDVDGETTDELQSDYEVDETTPENKRKKWFLRNKESRSYEELDENMARIEEELSNQGTVESKAVDKINSNTEEGEKTVVKRGRGRPRIYKISDQKDKKVLIKKTVNESKEDGANIKRKRGRPRIYKVPEDNTPENSVTNEDPIQHDEMEDEIKSVDNSVIQKRKKLIENDFPICRGKRIIKVAKLFSDYELPDFVKAQAEKCNVKRRFHSRNRFFTNKLKNVFTDREKKNSRNEKSPHKRSIQTKTTKCVKCGQVFRDHNVMLQHVASVHLSPYKSTWNKKKKKFCFLCRYCPNYFNTYIKFLDHVTVHSEKLLKQLEGKNFKGNKDRRNLKKLARQEQIASLSVNIDQEVNETGDNSENLLEVDNLKERLSRSSRASSVSSCDTDSSKRTRTRSRQKLEFSEKNMSEDSDKDTNKKQTSTLTTRRKTYSCQLNDSVNETTEDDKNTEDGSSGQTALSKSKSMVLDEKDGNHSDKEVKNDDNSECMKPENEEVVERIISTRGKIYKIAKSPEILRNVENVRKDLQGEEMQNEESEKVSETSTLEQDESGMPDSTSKSLVIESRTKNSEETILNKNETADTNKINFKRTISTRKKTYVYDEIESTRGDEDANALSENSVQTKCNIEISEKEKNSAGTVKSNNSETDSLRIPPENSTKQPENSDRIKTERRTRNKCYVLKDVGTASEKESDSKELSNLDTAGLKENIKDVKEEENTTSTSDDTTPSRQTRSKDRNDNKPYIGLRNMSERKTKKEICYLDLSRHGRKEKDSTDSKEMTGSSLDRNTRNREQLSRKSEENMLCRKSRSRTNSGTSHNSDLSDDKLKTGDLKKMPKLNNEDSDMKRKRENRRNSDTSCENKKSKLEIDNTGDDDVKCKRSESEEKRDSEKSNRTPDSGRISTRSGFLQAKSSSKTNDDTKMNLPPLKTRSRSSPGNDQNKLQHRNLSPSRETTGKLVSSSEDTIQKCMTDLKRKGEDCKDKVLNTISARKSNLRSSFASKFCRGSVFGIRAQRLMSRNEKKENSLKKLMSSKKRAMSREIISKSNVSCSIRTSTEKIETASDTSVTEKLNMMNTSVNKRLSTDEELLAAAGCLESSRRLRVNLDRNVTELLNKDKNLTCVKLESENKMEEYETMVENNDVDQSQNTDDTKSTVIGLDSEKSSTRSLRDRKRLKRKELLVDSDDEINKDKNVDKDYEISESEEYEESENGSNIEEEEYDTRSKKRKVQVSKFDDETKHNVQESKNKEEKEQLICASIDDEEFAFVKTPVSCDNTEKQSKELMDCKKMPYVDNKAAFIDSFKSYIDTARDSNSSVVSKVGPSKRDISHGLTTKDSKDQSQKVDNSNTECSSAFLDSFKMYIGKKQKDKVDLEKELMYGRSQTNKERSKSAEDNKTSKDNDKVKERKNSGPGGTGDDNKTSKDGNKVKERSNSGPGGSKQSENIRISAAMPVSDYLRNFKAYISQSTQGTVSHRDDNRTNSHRVDNNKVCQRSVTRDIYSKESSSLKVLSDLDSNKSNSESSLSEVSSSQSDTKTIPAVDKHIQSNSDSYSVGSKQSNSGSNSFVGTNIQSNTNKNKPGHSSFQDSFLAHCVKNSDFSDNNFECVSIHDLKSSKSIMGKDERKINTLENQTNKGDKLVDIQTAYNQDEQVGEDQIKGDKLGCVQVEPEVNNCSSTEESKWTESIDDNQNCSRNTATSETDKEKDNVEITLTKENDSPSVCMDKKENLKILKDEVQNEGIPKDGEHNIEISENEGKNLEMPGNEVENMESSTDERQNFEMSNDEGENKQQNVENNGQKVVISMDLEQNMEIFRDEGQNLEKSKDVQEMMEISTSFVEIKNEKGENEELLKEKGKTGNCEEEMMSMEKNEDEDYTARGIKSMTTDVEIVIPRENKKYCMEGEVTMTSQLTSELNANIANVESSEMDIIQSQITECDEEDLSLNSDKEQDDNLVKCERKISQNSSSPDNLENICEEEDHDKTSCVSLNFKNEYHNEKLCSETSNLENKNDGQQEKAVILLGTSNIENVLHGQQQQKKCSPIPNMENDKNDENQEKDFEISALENERNNELHTSSGALITEQPSEQKTTSSVWDVDNENIIEQQTKTVSAVDNEISSELEKKGTLSDMKSECLIEEQNSLSTSSVSSEVLQTRSLLPEGLQTRSVPSEVLQTSSVISGENISVPLKDLQASFVLSEDLQTSSLSSRELESGSGSSEKQCSMTSCSAHDGFQESSVSSGELQASSVSSGELQASSVSSEELQASSISSGEQQSSSVSSGELQASSVISGELQASSISAGEQHSKSLSLTEQKSNSVLSRDLLSSSESSENLHVSSEHTEQGTEICFNNEIKEASSDTTLQSDSNNETRKTLELDHSIQNRTTEYSNSNIQTRTTSISENAIHIQITENSENVTKSKLSVDDKNRKTDSSKPVSSQSDDTHEQVTGKSDPLENNLQLTMETGTTQKVDPAVSVKQIILETMETDSALEQIVTETINKTDLSVKQVAMAHVGETESEETTEKTGNSKTTVNVTESETTGTLSSDTVNEDQQDDDTSNKAEKKKPVLKSVSCQSGPATVRISPVQDGNKGKQNVKNKSVMTLTQDLRPNTRQSKSDAKRFTRLAQAKGMDNLPSKGVIELPSECIDKSNVQLPDLPPVNTFQEKCETSDNTTANVQTRSSSRVKNTISEEQNDNKDSIQLKKTRSSVLKSLRENIPDTPFTWDMDEGADSKQVTDKTNQIQKKSTEKCQDSHHHHHHHHQIGSNTEQSQDNKKHSVDLTSRKASVDNDLNKKSDSCHDDNVSIISDDTKSVCSNSDHTDTESAHSGTSSVERIIPKSCSGKPTNKVRHIYHHGKIWNIGKGHVTSVPVHQVQTQEGSMCESGHKSESSVSLHRHETVLHVIEVDRKHDAGGKHVVGVTEDEEFSEFHTYTSRDVSNIKNKTESDDKPAKRWKIEQGKRKSVTKSGATYPYVFKKSRKK